MKRLLRALLPALLGSTAGYVVHQLMARRSTPLEEWEEQPFIVGSPMLNALLGAGAGLVAGPCAAFWTGFAVSAAAGTKLDAKVPALAELNVRLSGSAEEPEGSGEEPTAE